MNDIFNENVPLKTETPAFAKHVLGAVPSVVYNEDCVEGLKRFSDNYFDLAIVDPPYGWGDAFFGLTATPKARKNKRVKKHETKDWNEPPKKEYWDELFRVSKNQIVWGGNYFPLPISRGWIFWDKGYENTNNFSAGELAWTSFDKILKKVYITNRIMPHQLHENIHPCQKPIKLYDWIIQNYCADANLILDTHVGSGSSRIAAAKAGKQFIGFEIDPEYYEKQEKRFKDFVSQLRMF
jgi:site-specific DNA-methyltransferase (adenine-specific)